ncbi:hypothetical protein Celaphus_00000029, partial [Cervus elaphus hippelaphus]
NLLKKQVETRTADGRRRITPLCIAQLDTGPLITDTRTDTLQVVPEPASRLLAQGGFS